MKRIVGLVIAACVFPVILAAPGDGRVQKAQDSKETKALVLDINRASAEDFEKLPGIGPEFARRIVTYRKKHGPFRRVEDLIAIRGIGLKKWRAIRPYLTVGDKREKDGKTK